MTATTPLFMNELVLATSNQGKIAELTTLLFPIRCIPQDTMGVSSIEETAVTFIENAIAKARYASCITGKPAIADDSGLVVDALQGQPGIYSARFAGLHATDEQNTALLLEKLSATQEADRQAYFYCAMAIVQHHDDPVPLIATGILHGMILNQPMGHNGFGYDPVFYVPSMQCSLAQLDGSIKNTISHRSQALNTLLVMLTREKDERQRCTKIQK